MEAKSSSRLGSKLFMSERNLAAGQASSRGPCPLPSDMARGAREVPVDSQSLDHPAFPGVFV